MALAKAAEITRNWDRIDSALETALKKKEFDDRDIKQIKTLYDGWQDYLKEAKQKATKWDEDAKQGDQFKKYVKNRESIASKLQAEVKRVQADTAGRDQRAKAAAAKLRADLKKEIEGKIKEADDAITLAKFAYVNENGNALKAQYKLADRIVDVDLPELLSATGMQKAIKEYAAKSGVQPDDLEIDYKAFVAPYTKSIAPLVTELGHLQERVAEFEKEKKHAETADPSASPEYRRFFKKTFDSYRKAYDELKKSMEKAKELATSLTKSKKDDDTADNEHEFDSLMRHIESLTKEDLMLPNDAYFKRLLAQQITKKDIERTFKPLAQKALVMSKQAQVMSKSVGYLRKR